MDQYVRIQSIYDTYPYGCRIYVTDAINMYVRTRTVHASVPCRLPLEHPAAAGGWQLHLHVLELYDHAHVRAALQLHLRRVLVFHVGQDTHYSGFGALQLSTRTPGAARSRTCQGTLDIAIHSNLLWEQHGG
jgi:hypothetical protein